jgi:hypothetical protein
MASVAVRVAALAIGSLVAGAAVGQVRAAQYPTAPAATALPGRADERATREALVALTRETQRTPGALGVILRGALDDPRPGVRLQALSVVQALVATRIRGTPEFAARWQTDRDDLQALAGTFAQLFREDPDEEVRSAALRARLRFEWADAEVGEPPSLSVSGLEAVLAAAYATETSTAVRVEIVEALVGPGGTDAADAVLIQALDDPESQVVEAAALCLAQKRVGPRVLLEAAERLASPRGVVRMAVARLIESTGRKAAAFIPALEAALAMESDPVVRRTLERTLAAARRR